MSSYLPPITSEERPAIDYIRTQLKGKLLPDDTHFHLDDHTFVRFLRQKDGKKEKALQLLEECIAWRCEFKPYQITFDSVKEWAGIGQGICSGVTKTGIPINNVQPKSGLPVNVELRINSVIWMFEELMRRGYRETVFIGDFSAITESPSAEEKKWREKLDDVRFRYYPLFETKLFMVSLPLILRAIFAVIVAFMSGAQKDCMHTGMKPKHLLEWIDESQLLERTGGASVGKKQIMLHPDGTTDILNMLPPALS